MRERPTESRVTRRRAAPAARRRVLLLSFLSLLVVMAGVLANLGPLQHLFEAKTRLEKTTANVAGLQAKKDTLQAELAKLSEAAYLETLARGELAYVRPGEELYIVTESAGAAEATAGSDQLGFGVALGVGRSSGSGPAAPVDPATGLAEETAGAAESTGKAGQPGFFERLLNKIADLF